MPITPDNRHRYPPNWAELSRYIRQTRAGGRCECIGECHCHRGRCQARHGQPHPVTGALVVLTTAHLDHTPEHNDPANLRAYCQHCHLAYDADHHAHNAARTRHRRATADMDPLFELVNEEENQP